LEAVYNMQVFRLSTQGMLSVVLMDFTAMRDILCNIPDFPGLLLFAKM
jgi:hypothetical protein